MFIKYLLSKSYRDNYTDEITRKFNEAEEAMANIYQINDVENPTDTQIE